MLDNEEGAQLFGCNKDRLEPAETRVALRIVWSLTSGSLYFHCNTKKSLPLTPDSSQGDHKWPKSGQRPNSWEIPTLPQNSKNILATH